MGLHAVVGRLVELRRGGAELHGRRRHRQLVILGLGEIGLCRVEGSPSIVPALERGGEVARHEPALLLRVLGLAIGGERIFERGALLLELAGGSLERVARRAGSGGRGIELRARVAERRVVERRVDVEQRIAGGHLVVVLDIDADDRP